jgi:hypothetical protein
VGVVYTPAEKIGDAFYKVKLVILLCDTLLVETEFVEPKA